MGMAVAVMVVRGMGMAMAVVVAGVVVRGRVLGHAISRRRRRNGARPA
jgi:hypothetical protein